MSLFNFRFFRFFKGGWVETIAPLFLRYQIQTFWVYPLFLKLRKIHNYKLDYYV